MTRFQRIFLTIFISVAVSLFLTKYFGNRLFLGLLILPLQWLFHRTDDEPKEHSPNDNDPIHPR